MRWIFAVAVLLFGPAGWAQTASSDTEAAVAAVRASIDAAQRRQQTLPPAQTDSERLLRMGELEQAPRDAMAALNLGALSGADRSAVWEAVSALIQPIDEANQKQLLAMVPEEGWFSISRYGRDAARAAFLIVQHADQALWRRFLPTIEQMARADEAEGPAYALMYDRLALSENRPQRYGSQMSCEQGRYVTMQPVEKLQTIDARRAALRMSPYTDYLKIYAEMRC
jgi:hypothetical protein